jgi:hypothetical protein
MTPPADARLQSDELLIPIVDGTAVIDGVTITQKSRPAPVRFETSHEYLVFANVCSRFTLLPMGSWDVFEITASDRIVPFKGLNFLSFNR